MRDIPFSAIYFPAFARMKDYAMSSLDENSTKYERWGKVLTAGIIIYYRASILFFCVFILAINC